MESKYMDFGLAVEKFFGQYLIAERGSSHHTIRSYKDGIMNFIKYFEEVLKIPVDKIKFDYIDRDLVCRYLDWLEKEMANTVRTRNQRCAILRSFFGYMMYLDPTHMGQWKLICSIRLKKYDKGAVVNFLSVEGIKSILEQIDLSSRKGLRDMTLLSLLYNSAARVQELADLTPNSIRKEKPYAITLHGKGNKSRLVPLDDPMFALLEKYMNSYGLNCMEKANNPLFFNSSYQKLTPQGIAHILKKYADNARISHPDLIPVKISPHVFRHSKAMHLLQADCPLIYIRDILGHESVQTTEIYARADSAKKRKALEEAYSKVGLTNPKVPSWEKDPKLKAFLKSLG